MVGLVEARLISMGLALPAPLELPSLNRTGAVLIGSMLYVSGHGAALLEEESVVKKGKLGGTVSVSEGYATARALALKMLATIRQQIADLDRVERVVKLLGMINSTPQFEQHNKVVDGASDLLYEVFGPEVGCHARSSVGVAGLVSDQPVEIEGIFYVRAD